MDKIFTRLLFLIALLTASGTVFAQQQERINQLTQRLDSLSTTLPGLNQKVQISVSGVSLKEYLNAIARSNNLSFHVDQSLENKINNTFTNVSAANILVLLAQQFNLDISSVGSILVIKPYHDPREFAKPTAKALNIKYSEPDNTLSMELSNDSLTGVARKITRLTGKNIIVPPALLHNHQESLQYCK